MRRQISQLPVTFNEGFEDRNTTIHPSRPPPSLSPPSGNSLARTSSSVFDVIEGGREGREGGRRREPSHLLHFSSPPSTEVGPWSAWGLVSSSAAVEMSLLILPPPQRPNMVIMIISHRSRRRRRFARGQVDALPLLPCGSVCRRRRIASFWMGTWPPAERGTRREGGRERARSWQSVRNGRATERALLRTFVRSLFLVLGRP